MPQANKTCPHCGQILPSVDREHRHLADGEEIWGELISREVVDKDNSLVQIGNRVVFLPTSLKLPKIGRVFVLRLEDKYFTRKAWNRPNGG